MLARSGSVPISEIRYVVNEPVTADAMIGGLPPKAAMMAAIEILLSNPAALGDDTPESGLYILCESSAR